MRLKRLQLHGYKTFATKTEFLFPSGITAIVGPNGSGKSNVADAIRWVLGEQSYRTLRGKRTADMIFSGSQNRSRSGMAEAILTLDNSDSWMPVDFSEVTIGRRAYRDGQNEYRLNNNRVRLRDVLELLNQSGLRRRTYTVIGQGLVDAVLSLRAQERRELFEEAAGIAHYRDKRADALRKLDDVQRNLERVHDIVTEIEPRLKRLERQAKRARDHKELSAHLERLLRTWYGYRWGQTAAALNRAQRITRLRTKQHKKRQQNLQALGERVDQVRQAQTDLRHQLGDLHRQSSGLHTKAEGGQRELAVLAERGRQLAAQQDEHLAEIATLDARLAAQSERVDRASAGLAAAESTLVQRHQETQTAQTDLNARLVEREALSLARNAAREQQAALRTNVAEHQSRWETLAERTTAMLAQSQSNQAEIVRLKDELDAQSDHVSQANAQLDQFNVKLEQARQVQARMEKRRQALTEKLAREQANLSRLRETEAKVAARFELLGQLRRDFAVYGQAARSLLTTDRSGVRGALAQLIQVSTPDLSTAVEAALGAYAGAIVVDDWQAAASALRHLRSTDEAGRVIFLPLSAFSAQDQSASADKPLSTQVHCDDDLRPLIDHLLGHTHLIPDLEAVRNPQSKIRNPKSLVTPQGEVWRSDGSIEGGRPAEQTSPLAQEQEWAQLNTRRVELGAHRQASEATEAQTRTSLEKIQEQLTRSSVALDELRARQSAALAARDQASRQVDRVQQEIDWRQSQVASAEADQRALRQRQNELTQEIAQLSQAQSSAGAEIQQSEARLQTLPTEVLNERLVAAQMALATARQTRQGQKDILRELKANLNRLGQEHQNRSRRVDKLSDEQGRVAERVSALTQAQADVTASLESLTSQIEPAEVRLSALEKKHRQLEQTERQARSRTQEFEGHLTSARLEEQRREDELARLSSRIEEDLGLVELDLGPSLSGQTPLPLHPLVSKLPVVKQLPEGLEEEIKRLRAQLRRLGAINPDAPDEYKQVLERHAFLQHQSSDLVEASDSLRQVIAEMDGLIEHAFRQTFEAVAEEFKKSFTALFGGGQARLELTDPDDLTQTGVEIVAHPPGKRLQALASLSGGERSLTAVALIFSILKISPTPFCILDEVDAMLDEANIGRFRLMLESLTQHTQIVIITHNRGTISAADTIYGISMGADSVSQAYSIKMEGEKVKWDESDNNDNNGR